MKSYLQKCRVLTSMNILFLKTIHAQIGTYLIEHRTRGVD